MPKLKTKSSAKKRFKVTATGKGNDGPSRKKARYDKKNKFTNKKIKRNNHDVKARQQNS